MDYRGIKESRAFALLAKNIRKLHAGKPHVRFDEGAVGNTTALLHQESKVWTYGMLYVYDADNGALLARIDGTEGGFSANGRMIYAVDKGYLKLYDGST